MSEEIEQFDAEAMDEQPQQEVKKKRPMFLTVLCILSLIWGIIQIYSGISQGVAGPPGDEELEMMMEGMEGFEEAGMEEFGEDTVEFVMKSLDVWKEMNFTIAILYIMGLFGVFLMWRLDKRGYFMYGAAHVIISFVPAIFVVANTYAWAQIGMSMFFTILFLVLYGLNLKHMKK